MGTNQATRPASAADQRPSIFAHANCCPVALSAHRTVALGLAELRRTDGARLTLLVAVELPLPVIDVDGYEPGQLLDVVA
jgi:hypothetical protein